MRRRSDAGEPTKREVPKELTLKIPCDVSNEQIVLAAMLIDPATRSRLLKRFTPDFFFAKGHGEVVAALAELDRQKLVFDPLTMVQLSGGKLDAKYLEDLVTNRPALPPNLDYHVEMLQWDRVRVEAARGPVECFLEALRDPVTEPETLRTMARNVSGAFDGRALRYLRDPNELVRSMMGDIERRRSGQANYPFGLPGLDRYGEHDEKPGELRMVPGLAPGTTTVITGLSGGGKTTACAAVMLAQAKMHRRVLYGAWEQGAALTLELMAVQSLGLSRAAFMSGAVTERECAEVKAEAEELSKWIRFFEIPFGRDRSGKRQFNDENLNLIHAYIAETGADVFVADLWRRALRQLDPDEEEIALYRQQAIFQETKCAGVLVHQQRLKDLEQREDKQPTREGLKGSGAWVEVADTIVGFHRPALFKAVDDDKLLALILKQRHGKWPLAVEFDWDADHAAITNGRAIEYTHPGQISALDEAVEQTKGKHRMRGGRRA